MVSSTDGCFNLPPGCSIRGHGPGSPGPSCPDGWCTDLGFSLDESFLHDPAFMVPSPLSNLAASRSWNAIYLHVQLLTMSALVVFARGSLSPHTGRTSRSSLVARSTLPRQMRRQRDYQGAMWCLTSHWVLREFSWLQYESEQTQACFFLSTISSTAQICVLLLYARTSFTSSNIAA